MKSPCLPELDHTYQYDHVPNLGMNSTMRMAHSVQPIPKHISHNSKSLRVNPSIATGPSTPSSMSIYDFNPQLRSPYNSSPETRSLQMRQETVAPSSTLDDEPICTCYLLEKLQGSYWIGTLIGQDQVSVIVPRVHKGWKQYAIVRRICGSGNDLPEQCIYHESTRFILCSLNGNVKAVLMKGTNMKLIWRDAHDGSLSIWWRKKNFTFNHIHTNPQRSSLRTSICSGGSSSEMNSCVGAPGLGVSSLPFGIQPGLLQQSYCPQIRTMLKKKPPANVDFASNKGFHRNLQNFHDIVTGEHEEQAMFELIKAHCMENNNLKKKMVQWATRNCSAPQISPRDISNISKGRLWITARSVCLNKGEEIEEALQESLNDIKGAYKQVKTGLYKQPEPQGKDSGVQHRLRKEPHGDPFGLWKIEACDVDSGNWKLCAKELPDGRWVDIKTSELIKVVIIPMNIILHKMGEEFVNGNQHVAKSIEFLFTSCNQKRLNSKLNRKNLRHNINNLKVRLKRQHALTFAIQVASMADTIARESEPVE